MPFPIEFLPLSLQNKRASQESNYVFGIIFDLGSEGNAIIQPSNIAYIFQADS
jgi:hypothetical protein